MTDIDPSDLAADCDGSRPLRGYLASPPGTGPWPAVVMIHESFGLDDVMCRRADRLADNAAPQPTTPTTTSNRKRAFEDCWGNRRLR